ncbi:acyl-CoA carboxylase subunit epsilon [Amycolatopsis echigonensis]|uniref:acyl-CoA carboxylase subunit epsilon n=1 Tax=Amycolatopsis echigonensis TaxID=2576905 RepID=UPI000C7028CB
MTEPWLHVVRGAPDDEEIAAVTIAILAALRTGPPDRPARRRLPGWEADVFTPPGAWIRRAPG